ncbi:MAG: TPM domain-containing protein [Niabella sp.]
MPFSLFPQKKILSDTDKERIVQAIREAENRTSGEIRVFMEQHCKATNPVERAAELFFSLQMEKTVDRNAVLLYVALKDHKLAVFGDEGIHQKTGEIYWQELISHVLRHFNKKDIAAGISQYVQEIGEGLSHHFPYDRATDHNELPDDIVFGDD